MQHPQKIAIRAKKVGFKTVAAIGLVAFDGEKVDFKKFASLSPQQVADLMASIEGIEPPEGVALPPGRPGEVMISKDEVPLPGLAVWTLSIGGQVVMARSDNGPVPARLTDGMVKKLEALTTIGFQPGEPDWELRDIEQMSERADALEREARDLRSQANRAHRARFERQKAVADAAAPVEVVFDPFESRMPESDVAERARKERAASEAHDAQKRDLHAAVNMRYLDRDDLSISSAEAYYGVMSTISKIRGVPRRQHPREEHAEAINVFDIAMEDTRDNVPLAKAILEARLLHDTVPFAIPDEDVLDDLPAARQQLVFDVIDTVLQVTRGKGEGSRQSLIGEAMVTSNAAPAFVVGLADIAIDVIRDFGTRFDGAEDEPSELLRLIDGSDEDVEVDFEDQLAQRLLEKVLPGEKGHPASEIRLMEFHDLAQAVCRSLMSGDIVLSRIEAPEMDDSPSP